MARAPSRCRRGSSPWSAPSGEPFHGGVRRHETGTPTIGVSEYPPTPARVAPGKGPKPRPEPPPVDASDSQGVFSSGDDGYPGPRSNSLLGPRWRRIPRHGCALPTSRPLVLPAPAEAARERGHPTKRVTAVGCARGGAGPLNTGIDAGGPVRRESRDGSRLADGGPDADLVGRPRRRTRRRWPRARSRWSCLPGGRTRCRDGPILDAILARCRQCRSFSAS